MNTNFSGSPGSSFQQRVWIAVSITALLVVLIWIIHATFGVLLLMLAAALIALYFRGMSYFLRRKLRVPSKASLPVAIVGSLLLLLLFCWFAGSRISEQVTELSATLPSALAELEQKMNASPAGKKILETLSSGEQMNKASTVIQSFFRSTFGVLGDLYVILFLSIFFTASPYSYVNGILRLAPPASRPRAREIAGRMGNDLTKWLKGQLFAMLIVTVLTAIGLLIMGVPMAFALALLAGILNFIPNFGPLIAMIPAVLVGFMQGPLTAGLVAGLYILVQTLESNLITPQIQKKMIRVPPALIIIAQLFMGVLAGGWGLVLATPLTVVLLVLIQELYIRKIERDISSPPAEKR